MRAAVLSLALVPLPLWQVNAGCPAAPAHAQVRTARTHRMAMSPTFGARYMPPTVGFGISPYPGMPGVLPMVRATPYQMPSWAMTPTSFSQAPPWTPAMTAPMMPRPRWFESPVVCTPSREMMFAPPPWYSSQFMVESYQGVLQPSLGVAPLLPVPYAPSHNFMLPLTPMPMLPTNHAVQQPMFYPPALATPGLPSAELFVNPYAVPANGMMMFPPVDMSVSSSVIMPLVNIVQVVTPQTVIQPALVPVQVPVSAPGLGQELPPTLVPSQQLDPRLQQQSMLTEEAVQRLAQIEKLWTLINTAPDKTVKLATISPDPLLRYMAIQVMLARQLPCQDELIGLLLDANPTVQQAARQGLVQLNQAVQGKAVDFGPAPGANLDQQREAAFAWKLHWQSQVVAAAAK